MPASPSAPKKHRKWPWVTGAVVAGFLVIGAVAPDNTTDGDKTADTANVAASATLTATRNAAATTTSTAPVTTTVVEAGLAVTPVSDTVGDADTANDAMTVLGALPVKGRAPKTGYDRALFGQAWSDDVTVDGGHNGCDTRNDILRRDLTAVVLKPGSNGCAVLSGTLDDPYTGTTIPFTRGASTSTAVQIDHVVALSDAWQKGAQQLDPATLRNFANDPRNLQATDGPANQQKSDGDAATWLPANKSHRCTYVARQVDVKAAYGLWVTQTEHDAIARVLGDCGATIAPAAAPAPVETTTTRVTPAPTTEAPVTPYTRPYTPAPEPTDTPAPAPVAEAPAPSSTYYANCSAVRAAGAAPIYAGQPGYSSKLDRDGDGVACE